MPVSVHGLQAECDPSRGEIKGVTISTLCKVLDVPRWVYFSTGRAGFRSRRDVTEDTAASKQTAGGRAHTRTQHTHGMSNLPPNPHTPDKNTVSGLSARTDRPVNWYSMPFLLLLVGSSSTPTRCTLPKGRRIMHTTKHVRRNN